MTIFQINNKEIDENTTRKIKKENNDKEKNEISPKNQNRNRVFEI